MEWKIRLNQLVMWTVKKHWIFLVLIVGFQYMSGKIISGEWPQMGMSLPLLFRLHKLNGALIGLTALLLAVEKGYLYLLRKGKV